MKKMQAKFNGKCVYCNRPIKIRDWILWNHETKKACHVGCEPTKEREKLAEVDHGKTGFGLG